jgi:hypothetical protein
MTPKNRVSFELAKLLKDKGFPQYTKETNFVGPKYSPDGDFTSAPFANGYAAPFIWDVLEWLREEHHVMIVPIPISFKKKSGYNKWECDLYIDGVFERMDSKFSTYNEACEAAIKYCLENLI